MKRIYMSLSMTQYSLKGMEPDCDLYQQIDDEPATNIKLSYAEACKLMWELVLAGATRIYRSNTFNPSISYVEISLWTRH